MCLVRLSEGRCLQHSQSYLSVVTCASGALALPRILFGKHSVRIDPVELLGESRCGVVSTDMLTSALMCDGVPCYPIALVPKFRESIRVASSDGENLVPYLNVWPLSCQRVWWGLIWQGWGRIYLVLWAPEVSCQRLQSEGSEGTGVGGAVLLKT